MTPFSFSLLEFLKIGYIGPLCLTLASNEVKTILGDPPRQFYKPDGSRGERCLIWKYGCLELIFNHEDAVKKIVLYPVQLGAWPDLPDIITEVRGYPTSDLRVSNFESYVKHNKLSYFIGKSPFRPRTYTFLVEDNTEAFFTVEGLVCISVCASRYD